MSVNTPAETTEGYIARDLARVSETVQSWKNALLDLSTANSLIALPETGCVDMSTPNEVFDPLVRRRKVLNYWDIGNKSIDRNILREPGNYAARAAAMANFRELHNQAVALLSGQDINVLFIAFGILNWLNPETGESVRSPLLLVPVSLEPHADGTGYTITAMEEPVEVNPILKLRLAKEDIGFTLPPSPDERYLIPSSYLGNVTTTIEAREGWSVEERAVLGRFPLLKLRLYEDLTAQEDRALSHPLIAALAGQTEALSELPSVIVPNLADLERDDASESQYLLLDADPAQERAIVSAARGQSFVLQGPPGTGKTQTIANIIGECAAAGKSVLLVSGRMASLDAVHQRLSDKNLGDLCLLAHSLKTSKRNILSQLEQTMASPGKATGGAAVRSARQKERDEMKTLRGRLNEFTDALHRKQEPLGISVYEAAGRTAEATQELTMGEVSPLTFPVREIKDISPEVLSAMEAKAQVLAGNPALTESEGESIWSGAFNDSSRSDLGDATESVLRLLEGQMKRIEHAAQALAPLCGLGTPSRLSDTALLLETGEALLDSASVVQPVWLTGAEDPEALRGMAEELVGRYASFKEQRDALLRRWEEELLEENHTAIIERLDTRHNETLTPLLGEDWRDRVVSEFEHIASVLEAVGQDGRVLTERLTYLSDKSGLVLDGSLDARQKLLKISRQAIELPNPCVGWFAPGATERLVGVLQDSKTQWDRFRKGTDQLYTHYSEDILDLSHNELLSTLDGQRGGFGRIMSFVSNKVVSALRGVTKPGANIKDRDPEEDLRLASEMKDIRRWCLQNLERFTNSFGSYYLGMDTDWAGVRLQLEKSATLCAEFEDGRVPAPLIALMLLGDSDLKQFESVFQQVNALLAHLRDAWEKLTMVAVSVEALPDPTISLPELTTWCDDHRKAVVDFHDAYRLTLQYRRGDDKDAAAPPLPVREVLTDLREAEQVSAGRAAFDNEYETLGARYGGAYKGKDTDWAGVFAGLSTASRLRASFSGKPIPDSLTERLSRPLADSEKDEIRMVRQMLQDESNMMASVFAELDEIFKPEYLTVAKEGNSVLLPAATFSEIVSWTTTRLAATGNLSTGLRVQALRDECAGLRLEGFFDAVFSNAGSLSSDTMLQLFRAGFYRTWAETYLSEVPGILPFSGASHEAKIDRFRDLDRHQMDAVPGLIRELVRVRSPKNYPDEVKTLKGQLARRRTGEVRRLLAEIPNLLFALKPIVMMNPLSVRLFLDANALHFDVVLFDDASQISTEDAIGAILRGNQVIIAGDPKQIPPLALLVESDKPFESILDAANAVASKDSAHFGSHVLRWHYRSRNESLIAFSRRYFYPELVSFPSATVDSAIDYVETTTDENGIDVSGPEKVVNAVLTYAKEHPEHSIGVVALDDADYERITEEIARRKEADPELSFPGEHDENGEGFFLKTLENVQGDERDMVVLYVGTDPSRCKPLSAFGGERLLNVAITRARCRMVIVSAFLHDAPTPDEVAEHQGMLLLRSFLRYAKEGVDKTEIGALDDPAVSLLLPGTHMPEVPAPSIVENVIERLLKEKGHQLRRQVGLSEYRVDLAVVDPEKPGRYLLGIEFDGPMYATGETARHRDRLRVDMLLDRGWNLHRVWALDFEADPRREMARIEAAIAHAKKHGVPGVRTKARRVSKKDAEVMLAE